MFLNTAGVEIGEWGDPIPWKDPCSPLLLVDCEDPGFATSITGKRELVRRSADGGTLLIAWAGRHRTDVFQVDDPERALDGLASRTGMVR